MFLVVGGSQSYLPPTPLPPPTPPLLPPGLFLSFTINSIQFNVYVVRFNLNALLVSHTGYLSSHDPLADHSS